MLNAVRNDTPVEGLRGQTAQSEAREWIQSVLQYLNSKVRGKDNIIELTLAAFLGSGHVLVEGPPGTGKTSLAKAMSEAFGGTFRRIQMTSDLVA